MNRVKSIDKEHVEFINKEFHSLGQMSVGKFRDTSKKSLLINSAPFIDEDVYPFFLELARINNIRDFSFFGLPIEEGRVFLEISSCLPKTYAAFLKIMEDTYLHYTGGIGYDKDRKILFCSSADIEILEVQINTGLHIPELDQVRDYLLSINQAEKLIQNHLIFLSPPSDEAHDGRH